MAARTDRPALSTDQTFIAVLTGLTLLATLYYAIEDDLTVSGALAIVASAAGLYFVQRSRAALASPAAGGGASLRPLLYVFGGAWALSWLLTLTDRGFFTAVEILGIGIALAATYLMLRVIAQADRPESAP